MMMMTMIATVCPRAIQPLGKRYFIINKISFVCIPAYKSIIFKLFYEQLFSIRLIHGPLFSTVNNIRKFRAIRI